MKLIPPYPSFAGSLHRTRGLPLCYNRFHTGSAECTLVYRGTYAVRLSESWRDLATQSKVGSWSIEADTSTMSNSRHVSDFVPTFLEPHGEVLDHSQADTTSPLVVHHCDLLSSL